MPPSSGSTLLGLPDFFLTAVGLKLETAQGELNMATWPPRPVPQGPMGSRCREPDTGKSKGYVHHPIARSSRKGLDFVFGNMWLGIRRLCLGRWVLDPNRISFKSQL